MQAESDLKARELEAERQRQAGQPEQQIANCRILAPTNGVVIYHSTMQASRRRWGGEPLLVLDGGRAPGAAAHRSMATDRELSVPESSLTKLELGQAASRYICRGRVHGTP